MTKKVKIGLVLGLLLMSFAIVQLSAMRYCPAFCVGQCGCEGELSFPDICCFFCDYEGMRIECCSPSWPGAADGCQIWNP
jgi:hypothetical protein